MAKTADDYRKAPENDPTLNADHVKDEDLDPDTDYLDLTKDPPPHSGSLP